MINSWNDPNYPTLDLTVHSLYAKNHNQKSIEIKSTEILFAGSCDISGAKKDMYWHEIYCNKMQLNHDNYLVIGNLGQPMSALIRKIYAYLKLVETPPKKLFMVAPVILPERILNSVAYPVSRNLNSITFNKKLNIIPEEVLAKLSNLTEIENQIIDIEQQIYEFCQSFSFLELLTKVYNIKLYWTPNLTRQAFKYYQNLDNFLLNHEFAKNTYLGYDASTVDLLSTALDFPSAESHNAIANRFLSVTTK